MKFRLSLILLGLLSLACSISMTGISTTYSNTTNIVAVTAKPPILVSTPQAAPISAWVTAEKAVHVRDSNSEHGRHIRYLYHGKPVTVYECAVAPDMGLWARIDGGIDGGWVNVRYLSAEACLEMRGNGFTNGQDKRSEHGR